MTQDETLATETGLGSRSNLSPEFKIACVLAMFFMPMKAFHLSPANFSVYLPYLAIVVCLLFSGRKLTEIYAEHFAGPTAVLFGFCVFHFFKTGMQLNVFVTFFKLIITLLMATVYLRLLQEDERKAMRMMLAGIYASLMFMVYQAISFVFFNITLPFTTTNFLEIGRGISERNGIIRVTGFTEEPSFIAVMLISCLFLFHSYQSRSGESMKRVKIYIVLGLLLCTSNNLFATIPLLLLFALFYKRKKVWMFFLVFYAANLIFFSSLMNIDASFFARFSSYNIFISLPLDQKIFGIGFNQAATELGLVRFVSDIGLEGDLYDPLSSLWGGLLVEGGILFTACFCMYMSRLTMMAKHATGYALMATLLMLANYYSPWWPVLSLTVAYVLHSTAPFKVSDEEPSAILESHNQIAGNPVFE